MAELVLLSVRPRFAASLLDGTKTVEIRRSRTRIAAGDVALVYSTSPERALLGAVRVSGVVMLAPSTIWSRFGLRTALRRREFDDYLVGSSTATAIEVDAFITFPDPVPLTSLRDRSAGFVVPQSYRYVTDAEAKHLLNGEARLVRQLVTPVNQ